MVSSTEKYFIQALVWSIRTDFEFVRWLIDTRAMPAASIRNKYARILYNACVSAYGKVAPGGGTPGVSDIILEIENAQGSDVASLWDEKIRSIERPDIARAKDVTDQIVEAHERELILKRVDIWLTNAQVNGEPIRKQFASMTDEILAMLVGQQRTGRPKDILAHAWSEGFVEPESSGYSRIDKALDGGFTPGFTYFWGSPSGHGKTSMACNLASRRAEQGKPTIIHSLEVLADRILFRMICDLAHVTVDVARNPQGKATIEEYERVMAARDLLDKWVRVYDTPAGHKEMAIRVRRHTAEFAVPILNIVDHIGIVDRVRGGNDWSEIEAMAYSITDLAKSTGNAFLVFSQISGRTEQEMLSNNMVVYSEEMRGSKGIRNAGDYVIFSWKHTGIVDGQYAPEYIDHTVIQTTKNRETGRLFLGIFRYDKVYYRLTNERDYRIAEDRYG